jgi:cell division protein DivIC
MPTVAARRLYAPPGTSRRAIPRWAGPLIVLGILIMLGIVFGSAYWDTYQIKREAARLARERDDLRKQNALLREEIRLLNTPEYVERIAREQLGLVKPGEVAVILVAPTPAPPGPAVNGGPKPSAPLPDPWWTRLWRRLTL